MPPVCKIDRIEFALCAGDGGRGPGWDGREGCRGAVGIPLNENKQMFRFLDFLVSWFVGFLVSWFLGFLVSCFCLVYWILGFLVSWFLSSLVSWLPGSLVLKFFVSKFKCFKFQKVL